MSIALSSANAHIQVSSRSKSDQRDLLVIVCMMLGLGEGWKRARRALKNGIFSNSIEEFRVKRGSKSVWGWFHVEKGEVGTSVSLTAQVGERHGWCTWHHLEVDLLPDAMSVCRHRCESGEETIGSFGRLL